MKLSHQHTNDDEEIVRITNYSMCTHAYTRIQTQHRMVYSGYVISLDGRINGQSTNTRLGHHLSIVMIRIFCSKQKNKGNKLKYKSRRNQLELNVCKRYRIMRWMRWTKTMHIDVQWESWLFAWCWCECVHACTCLILRQMNFNMISVPNYQLHFMRVNKYLPFHVEQLYTELCRKQKWPTLWT